MVKVLAAGCCALLLAACTSSVATPPASPTPSGTEAESPAANLRVHMELVLGEHVFAMAKLAVAAAAGRQDEYHSYAEMLAANGADVEALFRTALGDTAGGRFGNAWTEQNNALVEYLVAGATRDQGAAATAAGKLTGQYVTDAAAVLAPSLGVTNDAAAQLAGGHATALKSIVDDAVGANFSQLYTDIVKARVQAVSFGDTVTIQVAQEYADRFPGDPLGPDSTARANVNSLVQQQGYLMTMAGDANAAGDRSQAAAAGAQVSSSADTLASLFGGRIWKDEAALVASYARSGDQGVRQNALDAAPPELNDAFAALLQVIDDQRQKRFADVAVDDRTMAAQFALAADAQAANPSS